MDGDPDYASGEPIKIKVAIANMSPTDVPSAPHGIIVSVLTVSESENEAGAKCSDSTFYAQFVHKDKDEIYSVPDIDGAPVTSSGYKRALRHAFSVFEILTGGNA